MAQESDAELSIQVLISDPKFLESSPEKGSVLSGEFFPLYLPLPLPWLVFALSLSHINNKSSRKKEKILLHSFYPGYTRLHSGLDPN